MRRGPKKPHCTEHHGGKSGREEKFFQQGCHGRSSAKVEGLSMKWQCADEIVRETLDENEMEGVPNLPDFE